MRRELLEECREAARRGLEFLYRTACDRAHFELYGYDLLFCFNCIAANSSDPELRRAARRMGLERARRWRREHSVVPRDGGPQTIAELVFGSDAADRLGLRAPLLKSKIRRATERFTARDYLWFDPLSEPLPDDAPEDCACGADNPRGRKSCRQCRKTLMMLSRQGVWIDALIRSYLGERYGVRLGASFADVLRCRPTLLPYGDAERGANPEFYWTFYAVTHVVYTLNHYGLYRLSPRWLPEEFAFLKRNLDAAILLEDPEMMGEFLDSLKAFGLGDEHPLIRRGTKYLLSRQNADGSWGDAETEDIYQRYHPTFTAINGLREHDWRGQRLSFPKLKPLLAQWASERARPAPRQTKSREGLVPRN
ncbi:MAG TPA: hypothetical protein VF723_03455 [Pyrinomonadaceae bacterium]|jgi:hypothetical protein